MPLAARDGHPGLRVPARAPADGTVPFAAATAIPQLAAAAPAAGFAVSPAPITGVTCPERLLPHAVLTEGFPVVGAATGAGLAPRIPPRRLRPNDRRPANSVPGRRAARRRARHAGPTPADQPGHPHQRCGRAINTAATQPMRIWKICAKPPARDGATVMRAESAIRSDGQNKHGDLA